MRKIRMQGQQLTELALCLAVISGAIIAMQIYTQRFFKAQYKDGARFVINQIEEKAEEDGKTELSEIAPQYEPYYWQSNMRALREGTNTAGFPDSSSSQEVRQFGTQKISTAMDDD